METKQPGADALDNFLNEGTGSPPPSYIPPANTGLNDAITLNDTQTPQPQQKTVFKENYSRKWKDAFTKPTTLNISERMLPPLTRRVLATYETLQEEKFDPRVIEGDKTIPPPPLDLPPTYMFEDKGEKDLGQQWKMMKNVTRSESKMVRQADGQLKPQIEEVLDYVQFVNGQLQVNTRSNYLLFAWLECHPLNATNKNRDINKKPLFRRTDFDNKSSHVQMLELDLQSEADRYVKGLSAADLINLASAMTNPTIHTVNVAPQDIAYALRLRARNNPEEVLFKNPDKKSKIRIDVLHALEIGVLEFHPEKSAYFFTGDDRNPFHTVAIDKNPLEDVAGHLASSDGQEDYKEMMDYVNYYKN